MMQADPILQALALPAEALIGQRVPKKLLLEQGAPTTADRKALQDGVEELHWLASLKPSNCAVPAFRDGAREYLELAVLGVVLRPESRGERLLTLIHRAIPYPVLLIAARGETRSLSVAHKRFSQGEAGKVVLDGKLVLAALGADDSLEAAFLASLASPASENLWTLYQGWLDRMEALAAARVTGRFVLPASPQQAEARRMALEEHDRLERALAQLRVQALKEKQMNRKVELNREIKGVEARLGAVRDSRILAGL